jgi:hypothetical protein
MKVAIYARVSTSDKEQEYVDQAPANGLLHRVQWQQLLGDAARELRDRNG